MADSRLEVWWRETVMPVLLDRPLHRRNREVIESATVALDGSTLVVRGGGDNVIASSAIVNLITATVEERPPPKPLILKELYFPEMAR